MAVKKIIFFDVETNGFLGSSVLSISAMKISYDEKTGDMVSLGEFDRFYYRKSGETLNEKAVSVNGLTDDEITRRRNLDTIKYARTFLEDLQSFYNFVDGATHFVAHNIKFDRDFIPFELKYQFDTMVENIEVLKLPGRYDEYKWPTLNECAKFYRVPLLESELHNSMYDVKIMARVFFMMNKNEITNKRIKEFVINNIDTRERFKN